MSKETLQHTMRSKVRVFEDGGIRLLRKGQKAVSYTHLTLPTNSLV